MARHHYTEAFKQRVVASIVRGLLTEHSASKVHKVSRDSVRRWLKEYRQVAVAFTELKEKIDDLEKRLAESEADKATFRVLANELQTQLKALKDRSDSHQHTTKRQE